MQRLETTFDRTRPQRREDAHRLGNAFEVLRPEVAQVEQPADEPARTLGDYHRIRLGNALQPRRQVRRLANDRLLLRRTRPDQVAHHN